MIFPKHIGFLYQRADNIVQQGPFLVAMDLGERAEEIEKENPVPTPKRGAS